MVVTSPNWEALRYQLTRDWGVMQGIQVCSATGCSAPFAVATVAVRAAVEEQRRRIVETPLRSGIDWDMTP